LVESTPRGTIVRSTAAQFLTAFVAFLPGIETALADSIETKTQLCASCHGTHGLPSDRTVPIIWGQQAMYIRKQLNDYRTGDRDSQIMSSIAESLSDGEVSQIAAYFGNEKWPAQPAVSPPASPGAVATCQACHDTSLAGGMGPTGVAPRLKGQFSSYLIDTMTAYANGERANSAVMSGLAKSLSAADRKAVAEYLAALR
jgi:cytochrome c553